MELSGYKDDPTAQGLFWPDDRRLRSMAQTRNWAGDFFEAATASLMDARRHKTDSTKDVCPDLSLSDTDFLESKSVGNTNSVIVYDHRLDKDRTWTLASGRSLTYVIWRHKSSCKGFTLRSELWVDLARTAWEVLLIPLDVLAALCCEGNKRVINNGGKTPNNKTWGYGGKGYREGWMIPAKSLSLMCRKAYTAGGVVSNGIPINPPVIRCAGGAENLLPWVRRGEKTALHSQCGQASTLPANPGRNPPFPIQSQG